MRIIQPFDESPAHSSRMRAEDGRQPSHWDSLYEGVLLPVGALFLCMLVILLLAR